jgi:hypothetical protein
MSKAQDYVLGELMAAGGQSLPLRFRVANLPRKFSWLKEHLHIVSAFSKRAANGHAQCTGEV